MPYEFEQCLDCGRDLKDPVSRARGRGPVCQRRFEVEPPLPTMETVRVRDGLL